MKTIPLLIICLHIALTLHAQVSKTVDVSAGSLKTTLATTELNTITNLTLTGTIDARDFKTMRDNMPLLAVLDLSSATVAAYSGPEGTSYFQTEYPANIVPEYAFYNINVSKGKISLTSVNLPSLATSIGGHAFYNCTGLSFIDLPSSLISIEWMVFSDCKSLKSIVIPSSVTFIGGGAFSSCNSLSSIDLPPSLTSIEMSVFSWCTSLKSIVIPSSVTFIGSYAFAGCNSLITVSVPSSVKSIGERAFIRCSKLTSVTIPSSITIIENEVYSGCSNLTSITIPSSVISIGSSAFGGCSSLTLITIPSSVTSIGSMAFVNCSGLTSVISNASHPVNLTSSPGVFSGIDYTNCTLNVPYKAKELYATADQWKDFTNIVEATQGFLLDSTIISFSAQGGSAVVNTTANVTWTASSNQTWLILNPTAGKGTRAITFTAEANQTIGRRTAKVTVSATNVLSQTITIIQEGLPKTTTIVAGGLLSGLTADELNGITNLTITGTIDARDFKTMRDNMPSLAVLDLSGAKISAYYGTGGTIDSEIVYPENEIPGSAFFSNNFPTPTGKTSLISIVLPSSVTSIGYFAFSGCIGLTTVSIPASVNSIGAGAFGSCSVLTSIVANSSVPAYILPGWGSYFLGIDITICTLYVPYGTISLYAAAPGWEDFTNIVEMAGFMVSAVEAILAATQGSSAILNITSDIKWMANSDQSWLTITPGSEAGVQTLKFTAEANSDSTTRTATVTVSAPGVESQTIIVTQEALPTGVTDLVENSAQIKCYPNPFADEITIEIRNPKRSKITVDIYNITGERITNLITGISDEQVDIVWNGTNDKGQKVVPGVYICKMNNLSKKLIISGHKGNN